jgi:hypothetical protein
VTRPRKKPRIRYIYLVTSHLSGRTGVRSSPVLGVFTNHKEAYEHYWVCVDAQCEYAGSRLTSENPRAHDIVAGHDMELRQACISHKDKSYSIITLEKWKT